MFLFALGSVADTSIFQQLATILSRTEWEAAPPRLNVP
jgi:hypothetical protein